MYNGELVKLRAYKEEDIERAEKEYHDSTEEGYNYMFMGLKELVETGKVSYTGEGN